MREMVVRSEGLAQTLEQGAKDMDSGATQGQEVSLAPCTGREASGTINGP